MFSSDVLSQAESTILLSTCLEQVPLEVLWIKHSLDKGRRLHFTEYRISRSRHAAAAQPLSMVVQSTNVEIQANDAAEIDLRVEDGVNVPNEQVGGSKCDAPMVEERMYHRPSRPIFQHSNGTKLRFHFVGGGDPNGRTSVQQVSFSPRVAVSQ